MKKKIPAMGYTTQKEIFTFLNLNNSVKIILLANWFLSMNQGPTWNSLMKKIGGKKFRGFKGSVQQNVAGP